MGDILNRVQSTYGDREKAIETEIRDRFGGGAISQRIADAEVSSALEQRGAQRQYAEQAAPETLKPAKEMLEHLGDRRRVLRVLRGLTPEQKQEVLNVVPGLAQQMGDDRGGVAARALGAVSRGLTHGVAQPLFELVGAGGTADEIEFIRQLDAAASREFHPYRPGDPWYARGPLQAAEMAPWMASVVGGAGAARTAATTAAGRLGLAARATAGVARAGELAGITAAAFPSQYAQEVDALKQIGMEDNWKLRMLAASTATVQGLVEGIVPNPFPGGAAPLTQGAVRAARQYLWEAAKRAPGELSEEYFQGVTSGLGEHVAQYLDENAEDKSVGAAFAKGWEQSKEAALPMAFLLGVPAVAGAGVSAGVAAQRQRARAKELKPLADKWKSQGRSATEAVTGRPAVIKEPIPMEGVVAWSLQEENAEAIEELIKHDTPSRNQWRDAGLAPAETQVRENFVKNLRQIKEFEDASTLVPEPTTTEGQVQPGKEVRHAPPVRGPEAEVREEEGRPDVRGIGEEQVPTKPTGEVTPTPPEVRVDEPPVPEGNVRFYHAGELEAGEPRPATPRWLSQDRKWAEDFRPGAPVSYVDLPSDSPLLTKAFDDEGTDQTAPYNNFEAPPEIADQLQPLTAPEVPPEVEAVPPEPPEELARRAARGEAIERPEVITESRWRAMIAQQARRMGIKPKAVAPPAEPEAPVEPVPTPEVQPEVGPFDIEVKETNKFGQAVKPDVLQARQDFAGRAQPGATFEHSSYKGSEFRIEPDGRLFEMNSKRFMGKPGQLSEFVNSSINKPGEITWTSEDAGTIQVEEEAREPTRPVVGPPPGPGLEAGGPEVRPEVTPPPEPTAVPEPTPEPEDVSRTDAIKLMREAERLPGYGQEVTSETDPNVIVGRKEAEPLTIQAIDRGTNALTDLSVSEKDIIGASKNEARLSARLKALIKCLKG